MTVGCRIASQETIINRGFTGPTGPGATGPTGVGSTGPTGAQGIASFLSVYNNTPTDYALNDLVSFPSTHVNSGVTFSGTAATIVAPGSYQVTVSITATSNSAPALAGVQVRKNGTSIPGAFTASMVQSNTDAISGTISFITGNLDPGDVLDVQNYGGAITLNSSNLVLARAG